jgi:hypothetical protein
VVREFDESLATTNTVALTALRLRMQPPWIPTSKIALCKKLGQIFFVEKSPQAGSAETNDLLILIASHQSRVCGGGSGHNGGTITMPANAQFTKCLVDQTAFPFTGELLVIHCAAGLK